MRSAPSIGNHPGPGRVARGRLRCLSDLVVEALYVAADVRVLRRLHELAAVYEAPDKELLIPMSQEQLAELAGTSRATVNRVLREAERRKELELRRGRVVILNRAALARRAAR